MKTRNPKEQYGTAFAKHAKLKADLAELYSLSPIYLKDFAKGLNRNEQ